MGHVEIQSAAAAIENMLLSAHSLGYGACWMNVPFIAKDKLKELLTVKPLWNLIAIVLIGRPDPKHKINKKNKKELEDITTFF
jgi:nitroreductase